VKKRILIIEDNLISSTALEMIIESDGFESIGKFDSADDLVQLCKLQKPDLILLDIMLNGTKNGIEAAQDLRKEMNTPILFLTALSDSESIDAIKKIENSAATFKQAYTT
jgi:DNA-binding response OmpR family regulator